MIRVIVRLHGDTVIEISGSAGPNGLHLTSSASRRVVGVSEIAADH